ncbi:MAG: ABC transporter ATP-binding protein [Bacteroidia bacterium]
MTNTAIQVQNISKSYIKGAIGTGTLSRDIEQKIASLFNKKNSIENNYNNNLVWSLKDISFDLKQGEALGIIGKNGAGKSTLLKILSKVTTPTKGIIKGKGRIASLLEVGTGFHPELSGRENIFLNGAILGMKKHEIKRNFDEIVDFSGVENYIDTPVKRYSSGMYVRLAFAVAAHLESEILIVDEVLAVGDADFQKKCLGKMGSISKGEGRTVLFVSHNMQSIQSLCSKALLLNKGTMQGFGAVPEMINKYLQNNEIFIPLNERTDRKGDGKVKVISVHFMDAKTNQFTNNFYVGMDLIIEIELASIQFNLNHHLEISLGISDQFGTRITLISNKVSGQNLNPIANGNWSQKILINKLPLVMGKYFFTVFISSNGNVHDWIIDAFPFMIESDKFYGELVHTLPAGQGNIYTDFQYL